LACVRVKGYRSKSSWHQQPLFSHHHTVSI